MSKFIKLKDYQGNLVILRKRLIGIVKPSGSVHDEINSLIWLKDIKDYITVQETPEEIYIKLRE